MGQQISFHGPRSVTQPYSSVDDNSVGSRDPSPFPTLTSTLTHARTYPHAYLHTLHVKPPQKTSTSHAHKITIRRKVRSSYQNCRGASLTVPGCAVVVPEHTLKLVVVGR